MALRNDLRSIVSAGIGEAGAGALLARALDNSSQIPTDRALRVLCVGKTAPAMAISVSQRTGVPIAEGVVIAPAPADLPAPFELIVGGHPLPTADSERAGRRALALAGSVRPDETLLILLSGGASALMAVPAEGLTLADKRETTNHLLRAGADITALNTVRKHLSAIKGGWLAAASRGACHTLVVSDVVGDDLDVIGSGPTVPDTSHFADALDVLRRFGGASAYPAAVADRLKAGAEGQLPETPKPSDPRLGRATSTIIGGRANAMEGAAREAERLGYRVFRIDEAVVGDARTAARSHMRTIAALTGGRSGPVCVVSSGETTVHVTGSGKGGRNQEFVLAALSDLGMFGPAVIASVGTDGIDGPTDAAGALADTMTLERAAASGLVPDRFLQDNDSYGFFQALGDLLMTGRTDANVGDLQVFVKA